MSAAVAAPREQDADEADPRRPRPARPGDAGPGRPDLRWVLARERTLLAWFRVSLVLFLLGLLPLVLVPPGVATPAVVLVGAALMLASATTTMAGVRRWHTGERGRRREASR